MRGKLLALNRNILEAARRKKFKLGENVFQAFLNILVNSEKLDPTASLRHGHHLSLFFHDTKHYGNTICVCGDEKILVCSLLNKRPWKRITLVK